MAVAVEILAALSSKTGNNTFSKFSSSFLLPLLLLPNISLLLLKLSLPIIVANQFALLEGINSKCSDRCIYMSRIVHHDVGVKIPRPWSGSKMSKLMSGLCKTVETNSTFDLRTKVKPLTRIHLTNDQIIRSLSQ